MASRTPPFPDPFLTYWLPLITPLSGTPSCSWPWKVKGSLGSIHHLLHLFPCPRWTCPIHVLKTIHWIFLQVLKLWLTYPLLILSPPHPNSSVTLDGSYSLTYFLFPLSWSLGSLCLHTSLWPPCWSPCFCSFSPYGLFSLWLPEEWFFKR